MKKAGGQKVFTDEGLFGAATKRPSLLRCIKTLAPDDMLIVWKLDKRGRNVRDLIDPAGKVDFQFLKAHPTPGAESARAQVPDGKLPITATPFGRLPAAICYDMDFPRRIAQAGKQNVDFMLSRAGDWAGIDPRHTQMAQFRAIEQGFNLVRQANLGLSAAFDYQGRTLATLDDPHSGDLTLVARYQLVECIRSTRALGIGLHFSVWRQSLPW